MVRTLLVGLALGSVVLTSGCANSVLNDPEEMARRHASVERDRARRDRFWGQFSGPATNTQAAPRGSSSTLYQSSARTPSQCRAIGGTWNYGSNFCWRI